MRLFYLIRLVLVLWVAGIITVVEAAADERCAWRGNRSLGLWLEVEGVTKPFKDQVELERALDFIEQGCFTDIYCQVYRAGRAWFHSEVADSAPYLAATEQGFDPLRSILQFAGRRGIRVHAWVNTLSNAHNYSAPILQIGGEQIVLRDSEGQSLINYPRDGAQRLTNGGSVNLDTPAIWLDPSSIIVRDYFRNLLLELISLYPDLDGIHLDMVRYPYALAGGDSGARGQVDFGYSDSSVSRFFAFESDRLGKSLLEAQDISCLSPQILAAEWKEWRKRQLYEFLVHTLYPIRKQAPHLQVSAAVLAPYGRANDHALQDWPLWIRKGLIDVAIPMVYQRDSDAASAHTLEAVSLAEPTKIPIGLGAWLKLKDPAGLRQQITSAIQAGASGVVLFSYANLQSGTGEALMASLASPPTQSHALLRTESETRAQMRQMEVD